MGWVARLAEQDSSHVGGRYRLLEKLGTGGMSVVWRGYDEILGRQVAVKVLSPRLAGDEVFRERLHQEALAAAPLCHPHITGIFDFGESRLGAGVTVPYVVMELNDGESMSRRLSRSGPLPWREAVTVAVQVASALATAHARGVVHRDVTPANVMLTGAGAKVVDFGISALIGERDAAPDGSLLGTPAYLAPERLAGGHVLPATDVYALGLLLYRALTARLPWPAGTTAEALRAHLYVDPELLPSLPGMPARVATLCLRCLAKDPTARPDAAEVAYSLAEVVGSPAVIPPLPAADADQPSPAWAVQPVPPPVDRPASRPTRVPRPARTPRPPRTPRPSPLRVLLLRTGLRLGPALHGGAARPLGGGLFSARRPFGGGGLFTAARVRDGLRAAERVGAAARGGGHRLQAAAATLALTAVLGVAWATTDEPVEVGPAQAAAAGSAPAVGVRRTVACRVRYQVHRDSGTAFDAALTVVNTGRSVVTAGRVEFAYSGSQRLGGGAANVSQRGRRVVVRAGTLRPGRAVGVALRGRYRDSNPLPLSFTLAGQPCRVEVLGSTAPAGVAPERPEASGRSTTVRGAGAGHAPGGTADGSDVVRQQPTGTAGRGAGRTRRQQVDRKPVTEPGRATAPATPRRSPVKPPPALRSVRPPMTSVEI